MRLEVAERDVDLALVGRRDRAVDLVGGDRRVEGVGLDGEQRQRRATRQRADQLDHTRVGTQPAAQEYAAHARVGRRQPRHRRSDDHVGSITRHDEHRVVDHVVEHVRHRHRRHLDPTDRTSEIDRIAADLLGAEGGTELIERRLPQRRFLRDRPDRIVEVDVGEGVGERFEHLGVDPVDDDRRDRIVTERVAADGDALDDHRRRTAVAVDDRDDRCAEMFGDPRVDLQLDRRRRTREVGALDHDEVADRLDLLEALDDAFHARVGRAAGVRALGGGVGVADPLVGHLVVLTDELEVVVGQPLDDRSVEANSRHPPREQLDQAERHDRLPARGSHRRQVHRSCHVFEGSRLHRHGRPGTVSRAVSCAVRADILSTCSGHFAPWPIRSPEPR